MNQHAALSHSLSGELRLVDRVPSLRILIGEASGDMRRLLTVVLHRDGHEVVATSDGAELLEALAATMLEPGSAPFDLVVCAHALPGVPGLMVLAGLRSRDRTTPFILVTSNANVATNGRRLGAVILNHPFNLEALRGAIRQSAERLPAGE